MGETCEVVVKKTILLSDRVDAVEVVDLNCRGGVSLMDMVKVPHISLSTANGAQPKGYLWLNFPFEEKKGRAKELEVAVETIRLIGIVGVTVAELPPDSLSQLSIN